MATNPSKEEVLVFGQLSTGAEDDLLKATDIARHMVKSYGMSARLGARVFTPERKPFLLPQAGAEGPGDYSEATAQTIDAEVAAVIEAQGRRAAEVLSSRRAVLDVAAARLLADETLSGDELRAIVAAKPALVGSAA
jgi:cell division protease FtsH